MQIMSRQMQHDIKLIGKFTEVWCDGQQHGERQPVELPGGLKPLWLCPACADFVSYAVLKRLKCPLEQEKPSCKHCKIHCYAAPQRAQAKQIMAWSGRRMILRGRLDYIWHYFF